MRSLNTVLMFVIENASVDTTTPCALGWLRNWKNKVIVIVKNE